jgi:hypothetical protein
MDKCDDYLQSLRDKGEADEADQFICEGKLFFHAGTAKLWSISMYFIVITLTTCAVLDNELCDAVLALLPLVCICLLQDGMPRTASTRSCRGYISCTSL